MKYFLLHNKIPNFKLIPITLFILFMIILFWGTPAYSQGMGMKKHPSPESKQTLTEQISEMRSEVFRLKTALEKEHQGKSGMTGSITKKRRMKKEGSRSKMQEPGMMGMKMMGRMNEKSNAFLPSSLPGFPGMSHIYHMGSTDFFLDHSNHISLARKQKRTLNKIKKQVALENSTNDRRVQQLEQDLWILTSSDSPDIKLITQKIREIEQQKVEMRLAFIQAVGEAAKVLSSEQLEELKGMKQDSN